MRARETEAAIGGYLTQGQFAGLLSGSSPGSSRRLLEGQRGLASGATDQFSYVLALPDGDPDLTAMPRDFPRVCPQPDSLYGWLPLTSGDITVSDA